MTSFLLRSSFFRTTSTVASSEAPADYRPTPGRTDSISSIDNGGSGPLVVFWTIFWYILTQQGETLAWEPFLLDWAVPRKMGHDPQKFKHPYMII